LSSDPINVLEGSLYMFKKGISGTSFPILCALIFASTVPIHAANASTDTGWTLSLDSTYFDGAYTGPHGNAYEIYGSNETPTTAQAAQSVFDTINGFITTGLSKAVAEAAVAISSTTGATITSTDVATSIAGPLEITIGPAGGTGENLFSMAGMTVYVTTTMTFSQQVNALTLVGTCTNHFTVLSDTSVSGNYAPETGVLSATVTTLVSASDTYCEGGISGVDNSFFSFTAQIPQFVIDALNQTTTISWNVPAGPRGSFLGLSETLLSGSYSNTAPGISIFTPIRIARLIKHGGVAATLNPLLPDLSGQSGPQSGYNASVENVNIVFPPVDVSYSMHEYQTYSSSPASAVVQH